MNPGQAKRARPADPAPLPSDEALPAFEKLFEDEWVRGVWRSELGCDPGAATRIVRRQLAYRPGEQAVVSFVAEQQHDRWVVETPFVAELRAGEAPRFFRYPDDPELPGLPALADATQAQQVLPRYVPIHPQRLRIETVRYRPTRRAVLRYEAGFTPRRPAGLREASLFVRVMRPRRVARLIAAAELVQHAGFALPRIAGVWPEGGAVWLSEVPGRTVRSLIAKGEAPPPDGILDDIALLWAAPHTDGLRPFPMEAAYRSTDQLLSQVLRDDEEGLELLGSVRGALHGFVASWQPSAVAHNDFYDDQLLVAPGGRIFLVDFEEAALGDPMLDIGNFLAHMRWMSRFRDDGARFAAYGEGLRERACARFGWSKGDLRLREAFALFRLSTNPVRRLQHDWPERVKSGLRLAVESTL